MNDMVNGTISFLKHCFRARSKFDIHSPFLYEVYSKILMDRSDYPCYRLIEDLRSLLIHGHGYIKHLDLGAKSHDIPFQKRIVVIGNIAKDSSVSPKFGQLLYRLSAYFKPGIILELGTALGISTSYLAFGNPEGTVITIEGDPETATLAQKNFEYLGLNNIRIIIKNFNEIHFGSVTGNRSPDLIFVDGNHRMDATINYFNLLLPHLKDNTVLVLDDIHWSAGMEAAWKTIKQHPRVTISLDLFRMGILFFRRELSKEDYIIRF